MRYKYTHFIPQNTAPSGTKKIGVYNTNGKKVVTIPLLGGLTPPVKEKLYSFGLVSDTHIGFSGCLAKLKNAVSIMKDKGVDFCCNTGDATNHGYYKSATEEDPDQFGNYDAVFSDSGMIVYNAYGNHDSYFKDIGEILTGDKIAFYFEKEYETENGEKKSDIFIFAGQSTETEVMSDEHYEWLKTTLEANKDKRCFVFIHSFIPDDSGNALDVQTNSLFEEWDKTLNFIELLSNYNNAILFHGHSHLKFVNQKLEESANYTDTNGFKSVHVPSLGIPRGIDTVNNKSVNDTSASEGYIVDVYDDCIILNGMDFINNKPIPSGVYKIECGT